MHLSRFECSLICDARFLKEYGKFTMVVSIMKCPWSRKLYEVMKDMK